jgi:hypothetical protein
MEMVMNKFSISKILKLSWLLIALVGLLSGFSERTLARNPTLLEKDTILGSQFNDEGIKFAQSGQSSICSTPSIICQLPQPAPIGTICWCVGSSGPIQGVVVDN